MPEGPRVAASQPPRRSARRANGSGHVRGVGQQCEMARALHRERDGALLFGGVAGDAARQDLAGLGEEAAQQLRILVVDDHRLVGGEARDLLARERALAVLAVLLAGLRAQARLHRPAAAFEPVAAVEAIAATAEAIATATEA